MDKENILCKGCWSYGKYGACVYYKPIIYEGTLDELICPCTICLVKMMCDTTCLPLSKFRNLSTIYYTKQRENINVNSTTKRI